MALWCLHCTALLFSGNSQPGFTQGSPSTKSHKFLSLMTWAVNFLPYGELVFLVVVNDAI